MTEREIASAITSGLNNIANAITPRNTGPGLDAVGGTVDSLTEASMGLTAALVQVADAISNLADAVRETGGLQ
jgi:hypothetical protein